MAYSCEKVRNEDTLVESFVLIAGKIEYLLEALKNRLKLLCLHASRLLVISLGRVRVLKSI